MEQFKYKARKRDGAVVYGTVNAPNEAADNALPSRTLVVICPKTVRRRSLADCWYLVIAALIGLFLLYKWAGTKESFRLWRDSVY